MGHVTVLSGPERRRRWDDDERLAILAEAFAPGACVAEVSRRRDVATSLIYTWRRKMLEASAGAAPQDRSGAGFAEAVMADDDGPAGSGAAPTMIIDLARGRRISIFSTASPAQVAAALKALR